MFYEDQHKLAAYLERTGAEWEFENAIRKGKWHVGKERSARALVKAGFTIRPVLRYNLPSHLQSEIHNPDDLTEEQICEGGKYRAVIVAECTSLFVAGAMYWSRANRRWFYYSGGMSKMTSSETLRLPATVPWPDWEAGQHVTQDGVHTSHCCKDHGCKYGDDACPVVSGRLKQEYPCEDCQTNPDPKDARIAELEKELSFTTERLEGEISGMYHELGTTSLSQCNREWLRSLRAKLTTSPWRRMSEVPTEEDADSDGCVIALADDGSCRIWRLSWWADEPPKHVLAWMPVPKFHGWPDPLADLLKAHGVAVTPEILAALNAWKGVEK